MNYMTVREASESWGLTERRVTALCRNGKISGAEKRGKHWMIPQNAEKPIDGRTREAQQNQQPSVLPLPIGISDFREAVSNYYYVDKTLMIRDFLDTIPKVSLFTRPRRFGKTLNMDMLQVFFEISEEDTSAYFRGKKIWTCGSRYQKHQGKYPVIFLSFKDVKFESWERTLDNIAEVFRVEYDRHKSVLTNDSCSPADQRFYSKILEKSASESELAGALRELSRMLDNAHEKAPIIIIDEYDTPIQQGYLCGFYDKVTLFMRNLFSGGLKDNRHLSYGFLTGILRVAKESIFSGLNNLKEHSILDDRFSEYFGFTKSEILEMLQYYEQEEKYEELCAWYDGYRFGSTEIFNPWSVINYMDNGCRPRAFWQATGSNDIIREIASETTPEIRENLQILLQGQPLSSYIDASVIYPEIRQNPHSIYSFLLMAGYLKITTNDLVQESSSIYDVAIPNREIFFVYEREILSALSDVIPQSTAISIQQAILLQDIPGLQKHLQEYLRQTVSYFDATGEGFYHGLMLGLYAIMNHQYKISSNREAGDGRYDIQMEPYNDKMPGILVEMKLLRAKNLKQEEIGSRLRALAEEALEQIDQKSYGEEMCRQGIASIMKIGIAFHKKQVEIVHRISAI